MSIRSYVEDGKNLWRVYVNVRSKIDPMVRAQKHVVGLASEAAAHAEEKKLLRKLSEDVGHREKHGLTWESVIDRWELEMRQRQHSKLDPMTIQDNIACLRRWTEEWLKRSAEDITRGDARDVFDRMDFHGKSKSFQMRVRYAINIVYKWAIEERLVNRVHESPVHGLQLSAKKEEKAPEIFTIEEIRKLLLEAKKLEHPWYPIWAMALLTGMRSGELFSLTWSDIDLESMRITVSKSYNTRTKQLKCTKAGYWRNVPISSELKELLTQLKVQSHGGEHVLPRSWEWKKGEQARILRTFCIGIGLPSIRFHALRACFATQLLAHDVAPARVMKICGWKDLKTMQRYIRLAGIEEKGATEALKVLSSDSDIMGTVVNLFDFKARKP